MGMVREDFLPTLFVFLEVIGNAWRIELLTHQLKKLVNQNGDINEWKQIGFCLNIFNTLILPVDTTKIN